MGGEEAGQHDVIEAGSMNADQAHVAGAVVALGKFDGLHVGHRALAVRAAELGTPFMMSFSGMAEVLGWQPQLPVVAKCDRVRVMGLWAKHCRDMVPQEFVLEFAKIRSLSPEQFVEKLATELKVKGVVAGADYRFGFRAAGNASELVRLCEKYGLQSSIVDPVMDAQKFSSPASNDLSSQEIGQVSTTGVRKALAEGNMKQVAELLGREHRLVIDLSNFVRIGNVIKGAVGNVLNQPPRIGSYKCSICQSDKTASDTLVGQLTIEETQIVLELQDSSLVDMITQQSRLDLDFLI